MKLDGLVAIVTGGSSGLGEASVVSLVEAGSKVVIADRSEGGAKALIDKYGKEKVIFVKTDVSSEKECDELVEQTVKAFGAVHVVVNSAGIAYNTTTMTTTPDNLLKILKVNVVGTFNVSKAAALQMTKQKPVNDKGERGVIINVASIAGIEGAGDVVAYSTSKGGVIGMTLPLARDLGKFGIRVAAIAPGLILTRMGLQYPKQAQDITRKTTPLNRLGTPEEFANLVLSIAQNSFITGEVIRLDGGFRMEHYSPKISKP